MSQPNMRTAWLLVADALADVAEGCEVAEAVAYAVDARPGEWPAVAAAIRAMCGEDVPPPADVSRLALANRTLTADLEAARAERAAVLGLLRPAIGLQDLDPADDPGADVARIADVAARRIGTIAGIVAELEAARAEVERVIAERNTLRSAAVAVLESWRVAEAQSKDGECESCGRMLGGSHRDECDAWMDAESEALAQLRRLVDAERGGVSDG